MDLSFSEEQDAIAEAAGQLFAGEVGVERIKAVERGVDHLDRALWATLADAGLLGVGVAEAAGGAGGGAIERGQLLEEQGRHLAPVPLAGALVATAAVAALGDGSQRDRWVPGALDGTTLLGVGFAQPPGARWDAPATTATATAEGWRLDGWVPAVPAAPALDAVLVPARLAGEAHPGVEVATFVVEPSSPAVDLEAVVTTGHQPAAHLVLDGAPAERLGDDGATRWVGERLALAHAAVALGVAEEALRRAAEHTSQRHQFGRPLSSFQSTAHRAADAYIDVECMRATLWQACWLLEEGDDPDEASAAGLVASWWAGDGAQRVTHAVQHLHGGLGADVEYPVHRYFLWAKQLELALGSPSLDLARLGGLIAERARAGAAEEATR